MTLIWFILILGVIILVHEFGHFIFAKLAGVYVYEFSIGMGPKLFSKKDKKGETEYSVRLIPIGGFVRLAGEEVDDDKKIGKDRKLYNKGFWQRFMIMFAGPMNNFILCFVILLISALTYGSISQKPVIDSVSPDYPAYKAGIVGGDTILSINGDKVDSWSEVQLLIQTTKGSKLEIVLKDVNNKKKTVTLTPEAVKNEDGSTSYLIGVGMRRKVEKGVVPSLKNACETTGSLFKLMLVTVKELFTGGVAVKELSGPVGIYTVVGEQAKAGFESILSLIAFLSINVGVINLIPFPAFDGGRILFLIIEKLTKKSIPTSVENMVNNIGFLLLILLMIYVTFNDIIRLF